jgi:diacylglycerol kinase (ATP)
VNPLNLRESAFYSGILAETAPMVARVILNPYAGRYTGRKRWPAAEAALRAAGLAFELAVTERPGQAEELARQAALAGCSPIVVAGGDGTVGEVVNGLARAAGDGPLGPLGILPVGTANDIADTVGIPRDLGAAARRIAAGHARAMDLGEVNGRLFANNSAIGLEPYVGLIQRRFKRIQGPPRYMLAALRGILDRPRWAMRLEWDGGRYDGPISLVAIGNGPRSGGIFYMAPHADMFDGKLALVYGYRATRRALLRVLPRTLRPADRGSYTELEGIAATEMTWLRARIDPPAPAHADGEIFAPAARELEYRVWPGRLLILA